MVRTRVGYAGGTKRNPTYHSLGDHTETIQIDYDPQAISYEQLLEVFWRDHDPTRPSWGTQYRSVILTHDAEQERIARESKARVAERLGKPVQTAIESYRGFTRAEDYHQKYTLRQYERVMADLERAYPGARAFTDSTSAARLNGYLSGKGTPEQLKKELPLMGLGAEAKAEVERRVRRAAR